MRRLPIDNDDELKSRTLATARFRCMAVRPSGELCGGIGAPTIRPAKLLPIGGTITLAFLYCKCCVWQIDQVQLDRPPWSTSGLGPGDRYRCPGCRGQVDWHIHGPAWRPAYETLR
jgi:hypothetical protein